MLRAHLLGGLTVTWGDTTFPPIASTAARSLLAYLLTYRDRPHTRDLLAGTFWPDLADAVARRRLSQALWQVRRAVSPHPILLTEGDTVHVNPGLDLWLDVTEFEAQVAAGKSQDGSASAFHPAPATDSLQNAADLYRGDFLAGYYDDWLLPQRERLRELFLDVLERLVTACKRGADYPAALVCARRLAGEDPWREEAHREVMRLCHVLGRDAEAQRQYETCRRVLADDLGVEPSPETDALAAEIAARAGPGATPWAPVAARAEMPPLLERPDRLPLVGRQRELAELLSRVEAAAQGSGGLTLVYGEAGVGKTRLLQELARNARWRGIRTAWGRCYELAGPPAYQPLVEVLRTDLPALSDPSLEPLWRAELARLLPELATGTSSAPLAPEQEQNRLLEAIARGCLALCRAAPTLVLLEDAHWMDPASLAALRYVLPRLVAMPLHMVIAVRSEEPAGPQAEALAGLQSTRLTRRLDLDRLDVNETGELVQGALALSQPPPRFSARLYAETEGNAFFLTETLRALLDEGLLYRDDVGRWSTPWGGSTQDYAEMPLPDSVAQSIERRLDRLPAPMRSALDLAAVIGRGIPFGLWQQAGGVTEETFLAIGDELCRRGLFVCGEPGTPADTLPGADYMFAHDQIRRVAYDRLAPPRRRLYHRRVAEALTRDPAGVGGGAEPGVLAYHWTAAQVWDRAVTTHQVAGERARAVYANADAVAHYSEALAALARLPGPPDPLRGFELRLARETVYDLQGDRDAQIRDLAALARLAEELDDDRRRANVALRQARQAEITSDFPPAIAAASRAVRLARAAQDVTIETESHLEWGWALLLQGEHAAARSQFEQALALARSAGLRRLEADGLHALGTVRLTIADYAEAKVILSRVLDICREIDIRPREGSTLANLGYIATAQGDHAAAKDYNGQALRLHLATGDQRGAALVMQNLSDEFLAEGDFSAARTYLDQALDIQRAIQARENVGVTLRGLGTLFHQLGDYAQASDHYEQALVIFRELGIRFYEGQALAYLSLLSHHTGDDRAARERAEQGLAIAEEIDDRLGQGWLLDALGHALAGLGCPGEAADAYRQALALRQELDEPHKAAESLAGLARVALQLGDLAQAKARVDEILRLREIRGFGGANEPFRIYLTCIRVLAACQDPRAGEILDLAYCLLQDQRSTIQDAGLERTFLESVAAHREIIAAHDARQSGQPGVAVPVRLPGAGAPLRRPLGDDDRVDVAWTLGASGDAMVSKGDLRRQRLLDLLHQAEEQGAAPTVADLAQALGVSVATIKRDLTVLRCEGHPARTRGSPK